MENQMQIRPATRQNLKPLIVFYSESGCGKTYSALLLALGFVGTTGKIKMVDSESGRGEAYADVIAGGYEVLPLTPPFSPARYIQAHDAIVKSGASIGIMDSGSHEWEGIGGVLDMAGENESRSGKPGLHNWKGPKMEHAKFMLCLLQSPIPWIICLRAKYKSRQVKENGRSQIVKDEYTSPIQADDFIFEATAHAEILQDHSIRLTKCSHPSLRDCFPKEGAIKPEHGALLAKWCASAGNPPDELTTLKKKLQGLLTAPAGKTVDKWADWLTKRAILAANQKLSDLNAEQLRDVIGKTEIALMDTPA